ncbi:MAG: hypothetical protein FWC39_03840 [Bacteroidetes bacterium]|nr:hypothetical protein [Bacteroidota bacterium]
MLRTALIPNQPMVELSLPNHYVGKKVEFLIYISDDLERVQTVKSNKAAQFKGILSADEAQSFNQYITAARQEWDRTI